jgi:hypothetical protein
MVGFTAVFAHTPRRYIRPLSRGWPRRGSLIRLEGFRPLSESPLRVPREAEQRWPPEQQRIVEEWERPDKNSIVRSTAQMITQAALLIR